jgi:hypothetical protein
VADAPLLDVRHLKVLFRQGDTETLAVDARRLDVVVEASPVVPGEEDRGRLPVEALHDRVDQAGNEGLSGGHE